ncbi:hypothetical protein [Gemmiger formicilis]|uniref:hypothetical protein n=1 Tax=Gemmiger formicilis TaxID=745368 RepID=UPI003CCAB930
MRSIKIGLASPDQIRAWSYGEVTKPETINYRTLKPERDGLYCERILDLPRTGNATAASINASATRVRSATSAALRSPAPKIAPWRMGHIELAACLPHLVFQEALFSRIGLMRTSSPRQLDKVLYFANCHRPRFTLEKKAAADRARVQGNAPKVRGYV